MLHLRGAEGAKSQFRVSYTMMRLIEQDVVMQRLALESDDDKEQHLLDSEVRSLKPRECRLLSFGLLDIWCSCQDDKPFSIGETWEQIVRATQKARSLCCAWCGRTDQTFWYYNSAFWCIFKYLSVIGVGFNSLLITPGTFLCRSTNHRFTRKTALQPSQKVDLRCLLFKFRIRSFLEETHTHQCWKPCRMFGDAKPCWGMPSISFQRPWSGSEPTKPWKGLPTVPGTVSGVSADSVANTQIPTALPEIWWFRVGWIGICESLPHELPCCLTCGGVGQAIWARLPRCLGCGLHCLVALHFESSVLCTVLTQFDKSAAKDHVASNFLLDRAENRG